MRVETLCPTGGAAIETYLFRSRVKKHQPNGSGAGWLWSEDVDARLAPLNGFMDVMS